MVCSFVEEEDLLFLQGFEPRIVQTFILFTTLEMTPRWHGEKPKTNRLSYDTAIQKTWLIKAESI
jgi:hypothetical protein